jgi:hypothetical protein
MGVHDHHRRSRVYQKNQHPLAHDVSEFFYSNPAMPGVSNMQAALDWIMQFYTRK